MAMGGLAAGSAFLAIQPSQFREEQGRLVAEVTASPFVEVIPSWNFKTSGGSVKVELQASGDDFQTKPYNLGVWSLAPELRTSAKNQADEHGDVYTDTLVLKKPGSKLKVTLTLVPNEEGKTPELKEFFLNFTAPNWKPQEIQPDKTSWGRVLTVPEKAQHDYPGGNVLCSPTSISMLMNRLGTYLDRTDLQLDVPEIQSYVHDPAWGGTGNWPFNIAFPGSFNGIQAFVTRLNSLTEAERFIKAGIPLAVSVNYKILLQKEYKGDGGHLMVLIGFNEQGDPVINDPAKGRQVKQVYPRDLFTKAWAASKNTVYVVRSTNQPLPAGEGPWPSAEKP